MNMNKILAENKMAELNSKRRKTFCPICNGTCQEDCVVYVEPNLYQYGETDEDWNVNGGYCDAYSLRGGA